MPLSCLTLKLFLITDSGIESSTAVTFEDHHRGTRDGHSGDDDDESPPSLDTAIQRLAETIKEFDVHSGGSYVNGNGKLHLTQETNIDENIPKEKLTTNGNVHGAGKDNITCKISK